ncbi:hypothetical protein B0T24DRAFT_514789, partial [Lasiosphaeria ovina]
YRQSRICLVYLADVTTTEENEGRKEYLATSMRKSRWFTCGWTLQEFLAPDDVLFYDSKWFYITEKTVDEKPLSSIRAEHLQYRYMDREASIAQIMPWASQQKRHESRTRPTCPLTDKNAQNLWYCLIGLGHI